MMDTEIVKAKVFIQAEMAKAELYSFALGTTSLFTTCSPIRDTRNEDAIALIPVNNRHGALVVTNTVGDTSTSEDASRIVIESLTNSINRVIQNEISLREGILKGIEAANKRLCDAGTGSTTALAVLEIQGQTIRAYRVGDVLILMTGQRGKLKLQNVPHSSVSDAGKYSTSAEFATIHREERNIVPNEIGSPDMRIEIGHTVKLAQHDTLIIASDGLLNNLHITEIIENIRKGSLKKTSAKLIKQCHQRMTQPEKNKPHHPDDLSFIIYRPN